MKCPSCGIENEGGSKFCQSCGANMEEAVETTAVPPEQSDAPPPPPPPPPPPVQPAGQTATPPPSGGGGQLDMGGIVSKSFSEVFSDIGGYIVLALVVSLVSSVTMGILGGPLMGGTLYAIRRKLKGEGTIDLGTVFNKGMEKFLNRIVRIKKQLARNPYS